MKSVRVKILSSDSMGVRSLATTVEACGTLIGIDLGASLAPRRYGLPPHELELRRLERALNVAIVHLEESDGVIITHYHYDHYMRMETEAYYGKLLFVKHPELDINRSQRLRAWRFLKKEGVEKNSTVEYADGRAFNVGDNKLIFSPPVWHGDIGSRVGQVIMVKIVTCSGEVIAYASDVQGPADPEAIRFLRQEPKPDIIIVGGPPTYFAGYKVSVQSVEKGLEGLKALIDDPQPQVLIVDHHLLRDINYRKHIEEHLRIASDRGVAMLTAAEFMGLPVEQLEARRRELWKDGSG